MTLSHVFAQPADCLSDKPGTTTPPARPHGPNHPQHHLHSRGAHGRFAPRMRRCAVAGRPASRGVSNRRHGPAHRYLDASHNEEAGIKDTIVNLLPQLSAGDRIVVIADNCADDTATAARAAGAEVLERFDVVRRGKGYALDHGMRHLELDPPQVVVIVDADCHVNNGSLARISRASWHHNRPGQAVYLMQQPDNPGPKETASALAFMVRSQVRQTGLARLGMPCLLGGTGMAFPWKALHGAPLASGNIVEDMQLGLDLAVSGFTTVRSPVARHQPAAAAVQSRQNTAHPLGTRAFGYPADAGTALVQRKCASAPPRLGGLGL